MKLAAWEDNLLIGASLVTPVAAAEPAFPLANLTTSDPDAACRFRNRFKVVASASDRVYLGGGTANLNAGIYYGPEMAVEIRRAILAVPLTGWTAYFLQGSATRGHFKLNRTSGGGDTLTNSTTSRNALVNLLGFRAQDRSSSTTHVGDYPALHEYEEVVYDLGADQVGDTAFIVGLEASASCIVTLGTGATNAATDEETEAPDSVDDGVMLIESEAADRQYVRFKFANPRRTDPFRLVVGCLWYGPAWDTRRSGDSVDWEVSSFGRSWENRSVATAVLTGQSILSELAIRERFKLACMANPGVHASQFEGLRDLFKRIGIGGLLFVAADPVNEPHRETRLCRMLTMPQWSRQLGPTGKGQWGFSLDLEVIR